MSNKLTRKKHLYIHINVPLGVLLFPNYHGVQHLPLLNATSLLSFRHDALALWRERKKDLLIYNIL